MFSSIWEDIKREFSYGNMVTRLVFVNVCVFVTVLLSWIVLSIITGDKTPPIYTQIIHFFSISSSWLHNLTHPWVVFTSMFLHEGFFHILWNMLFLYWFGRIVGDLLGDHRVLPLYLLSGLVGNAVYFISANLLAYGGNGIHYALGASGAVTGIIMAAGVTAPDYRIRLLFLGEIKLKYIVGALLLIDLAMIAKQENTGGHYAHLGGALMGWFFVYQLRKGNDFSLPVNNLLEKIQFFFQRIGQPEIKRPGPRKVYTHPDAKRKQNQRKTDPETPLDSSHQEQLDAILDKIKEQGYESLTQDEKEFLFKASQK
jgi:membrane associated rhomboid family serine protease